MKPGEYEKIMSERMAVLFLFSAKKKHVGKLVLQTAVASPNKIYWAGETTIGAGIRSKMIQFQGITQQKLRAVEYLACCSFQEV